MPRSVLGIKGVKPGLEGITWVHPSIKGGPSPAVNSHWPLQSALRRSGRCLNVLCNPGQPVEWPSTRHRQSGILQQVRSERSVATPHQPAADGPIDQPIENETGSKVEPEDQPKKTRSERLARLRAHVNAARARIKARVPFGLRSVLGLLLVVGGVFGFLPILGFWMIPLGLAVIGIDLAVIWRRLRGRR